MRIEPRGCELARPKAPCGTYAAYRRHLREKTPICQPCRDAKRTDSRNRSGSAAARAEKQIARELEKATKELFPPAPAVEADELEEVSRLETLTEMLEDSRRIIKLLLVTDPARAYLQMREQRDILREIAEIKQQSEAKKEVSLGDQLAAARAARLEREALREAGA